MSLALGSFRQRLAALQRAVIIAAAGLCLPVLAAQAQVLRGSVRTLDSSLPVPRVLITVRDSIGRELGVASSDEQGLFIVRLRERVAFSVHARRIGFQMADTELLRVAEDTVDLQIQLAEVAQEVDEAVVTGIAPLNAQRLEDAQRRGWRVYEPALVARHRSRARDLPELLRSLGTTTITMPRSARDCVRSMRTNNCITYIVDGQVVGTDIYILPSDIYFIAVLTPSESQVMYGNRAMNGAIAIYTRQRGDQYDSLPPSGRRP